MLRDAFTGSEEDFSLSNQLMWVYCTLLNSFVGVSKNHSWGVCLYPFGSTNTSVFMMMFIIDNDTVLSDAFFNLAYDEE